jgi:hypothetical protein
MDRSVIRCASIHWFNLSEDGPRSTHKETQFDNFAPGKIITPDISNESFENVGTT